MNLELKIGFGSELESFLSAAVGDAASLFPNSLRAVSGLAEAARERWVGYASGDLELPSGGKINRRTGTYAESIRIETEYPGTDAYVRYTIYSDDPKARILEEGAPAFDMKTLLSSSDKTRISSTGKRYLIIPFRWGTPGSLAVGKYVGREMPTRVHTTWLKENRAASLVVGSYEERSVQDSSQMVKRLIYKWGDRLTANDVSDLGLDPDEGMGKNMVGMVKFDNPQGGHGQYVTFRVMSEDSDGWVRPAQAGKYPAKHTFEFIEQVYSEIMTKALDADVENIKTLAQ